MRRLLLAVDAEGYGRRAEAFQADMQKGLLWLLDEAAAKGGLRRAEWERREGGDGEFSVLPPDESEDLMVSAFVRELNAALIQYNRLKAVEARVRLRMALHVGPASPGALGFTGSGPVVVDRLCGCRQVRAALEQTDAPLAVILSKPVYVDTVEALRVPLDPKKLRRVRVREKEYGDDAWLWVPGRDVHALRLDDDEDGDDDPPLGAEPPDPPPSTPPSTHPSTHIEYFTKATINGPAIAGDQNIHLHRDPR